MCNYCAASDMSTCLSNNAFNVVVCTILLQDNKNTDRPDNERFGVNCAHDQFYRCRNFFGHTT